jgi:hypothetical protein
VSEKAVSMTSDNQLVFTSLESSGDFLLGLYCVAWLSQESVSSRIFVRNPRVLYREHGGAGTRYLR